MAEDVTAYGAVGDGTTDDTQAIRDAANAAGAGGTVYFPDGTYLVGSSSRFPLEYPGDGSWDGITWEGNDFNTVTIVMDGGKTAFYCPFYMSDGPVVGSTWKQLTLDGNRQNQSTDNGKAYNDNAVGDGTMRFEHCVIKDWFGGALEAENSVDLEVVRCSFLDNGLVSNAGHAINPNQQASATFTCTNCYFEGTGGSDIDIGKDDTGDYIDATVTDCWFTSSRGAFKVNPQTNSLTVTGTVMESGAEARATMAGLKYNTNSRSLDAPLTFEECTIRGGDWPGIDLLGGGVNSSVVLKNVEFENNDNGDNRGGTSLYVDDVSAGDADFTGSTTISCHDAGSTNDGQAIDITSGTGDIDSVIYDSAMTLGSPDGVTLGASSTGTPISPATVSKDDTGAGSTTSGATGNNGARATTDGAYNTVDGAIDA